CICRRSIADNKHSTSNNCCTKESINDLFPFCQPSLTCYFYDNFFAFRFCMVQVVCLPFFCRSCIHVPIHPFLCEENLHFFFCILLMLLKQSFCLFKNQKLHPFVLSFVLFVFYFIVFCDYVLFLLFLGVLGFLPCF